MGPVSSLPGTSFQPDAGAMCDEHHDRVSVKRVQGETDSFGAEYIEMCQECYDQFKKDVQEGTDGNCDWCGAEAKLKPIRDMDEGTNGPVYYCCQDCRAKEAQRVSDELDAMGY